MAVLTQTELLALCNALDDYINAAEVSNVLCSLIETLREGSNLHNETQASHGFAVEDIIARDSGSFVKAQATPAANSDPVGIVVAVSGDDFTFISGGALPSQTGLTDGMVYYLSTTAGGRTTTPPSSPNIVVPLFRATSSTTGVVLIQQGLVGA